MKKFRITISVTLILVLAVLLVWIFLGVSHFNSGCPTNTSLTQLTTYPNNTQSLFENATLWEKSEWEEHHGSVCQCIPEVGYVGPIVLHPKTDTTISDISFNLSLSPGNTPVDLTNTEFTLSTQNAEHIVRYGDPAVTGLWIRSSNHAPTLSQNILGNDEMLHIDLNIEKMGFSSSLLGPNERFSLIVTPTMGYRISVTSSTPGNFSAGAPIEISPSI